MKELISQIVQALVDSPECVLVVETETPDGATSYQIFIADSDVGKVIGKQGRIANALRTFTQAVGQREKRRVRVEIVEP